MFAPINKHLYHCQRCWIQAFSHILTGILSALRHTCVFQPRIILSHPSPQQIREICPHIIFHLIRLGVDINFSAVAFCIYYFSARLPFSTDPLSESEEAAKATNFHYGCEVQIQSGTSILVTVPLVLTVKTWEQTARKHEIRILALYTQKVFVSEHSSVCFLEQAF